VLCGLEPAEPLPRLDDLSQAEIESGLYGLHNSVSTIMTSSYFITTEMRSNLQATRFRGVLPLILAFMARTGYSVDSVDTVRLDGAGNVTLAGSSGNTGLMIRSRNGLGRLKRVFYFRQDLSNGGGNGPLLTYVSRLGRIPAFTKSASYLMHDGSFTGIRDFLLRHSSAIVQDPSGVPYREFNRQGWDLVALWQPPWHAPAFSWRSAAGSDGGVLLRAASGATSELRHRLPHEPGNHLPDGGTATTELRKAGLLVDARKSSASIAAPFPLNPSSYGKNL
jgi:hypothetical protein